MFRLHLNSLLTLSLVPMALALSCADKVVSCEEDKTCLEDASGGNGNTTDSGDGDTSSGGAESGDGDGDGDGDTGSGGKGDAGGADGSGGATDPCETCEGDTPACKEENEEKSCVECTEDNLSACQQPGEFCSPENICVECLDNTHCTEADASVCDLTSETDPNTCTGCTDNDGCAHLSDTPVCDTEANTCVGCTVRDDDRTIETDACGSRVCDPITLTCNHDTTQASKDLCVACTADNECFPGQNCIPLFYRPDAEPEIPMGGFCMKVAPGCSAPYSAGALHRESLSGAAATDYCGLAENFTTCAAIKDLKDGKPCDESSECGSENGEGICDVVNLDAQTRCSYSCTSSNQCVSGNACGGVSGSEYCGG